MRHKDRRSAEDFEHRPEGRRNGGPRRRSAPTAIPGRTPPRSLNVPVPAVTAAERADTARRGAVSAGELIVETSEQPS